MRAVGTGDVGDLVMSAYDAMAERFGRPMDYLRVDLLRWDDSGRVTDFKVMLRPLKAVNLIHERMAAMLARKAP